MPCIEPLKLRRACLLQAALGVAALAGCASTRQSSPAPTAPGPAPAATPPRSLPPVAGTARNWDDYRLAAARRIVAANPQITHTGAVEQPALAIPVLEVELNADGSIRNISVMREPSQAKDTTRIAIDAVRRAGPFGDVSNLPKPWRFTEAFLFNGDRRFKPRTLDL